MKINKKLTISAIAAFILLSAAFIVFAVLPDFSAATLTFSGIHMSRTTNGVQGLIDVSLKNIDTPALSFCIEYDRNYIELSNYADNTVLTNPPAATNPSPSMPAVKEFDKQHTYFNQNTTAFPASDTFKDNRLMPVSMIHAPIIGIADHDAGTNADGHQVGRCIMTFMPNDDTAARNSDYIEWRLLYPDEILPERQPVIITQTKGEVSFGQLSFNIKNPLQFSKLTKDELNSLIKVIPFSQMVPAFLDSSAADPGIASEFGMHLAYYNKDYDIEWYPCSEDNVEYNLDIDLNLEDISPQHEEMSVNAYEIFSTGTIDDLFEFLNEKMSMLTLEYADGSKVPDVFQWDKNQSIVVRDDSERDWNPKGGTYEVTQKYNDDFSITVTVNVTPVNLIGLTADNLSLTYYAPDIPQSFDELELPTKARAVLDTYIPNGGIPELLLNKSSYTPSDLPQSFSAGGMFTFTAELEQIPMTQLMTTYRWLTYSDMPKLTAYRYVVTDADKQRTLLASSVTEDDGSMKITVHYENGKNIPAGTTFDLKLPGGRTITNIGSNSYCEVRADGTDTADIILRPNIASGTDIEKLLARLINLGKRAGTFSIRAEEPDAPPDVNYPTNYADFVPEPRLNIYESDAGGNYIFDYSGELAAMFPVQAGSLPPTTVTLPVVSDRIITTYDGSDGTEKGYLQTFTVDEWIKTGDENEVGSVVSVTGTLLETDYTNYGTVKNPNGVQVTIKYVVLEKDANDSIEDIPDTVFSKRQVGYDYDELETKRFRIRNNGQTDLYGLSVVISPSTVSGGDGSLTTAEAFRLTRFTPELVRKSDSSVFEITTVHGLPVGTYKSLVTIYSNNKVLDTFNISFTVTAEPVYGINVKSNNDDYGSAKTADETKTATAGTTVTLVAEPETDCEFVQWTSTNPDVKFSQDASDPLKATFEMPESDVEITAEFRETLGAKLRAEELSVRDMNDVDRELHDKDWVKVNYDAAVREYYVAVPNDIDKVKLCFKPRPEAENATITVTHEHGTNSDNINFTPDNLTKMRESDAMTLDISPTVNNVILKFEYNDPDDDPDAGTVTRQYTIHIYRKLKTSELIEFNYGNSPYGLIMRDNAITDKQTAKDEFVSDGYMFKTGSTVPANAKADIPYSVSAWDGAGANYDLSDTALFITDLSSFTDPGCAKVQNSIGASVNTADITKSVQVTCLSETVEQNKNGSADDFIKTSRTTVSLPLNGAITELAGMRIRPDIYSLTYKFTDFDGTTVSVTKPLIILSPIGDVNASTVSDTADASSIVERFGITLADNSSIAAYSVGGCLNRYRVQDVNKDGYVNAIDANFIRAGQLSPFYTNLP